MKDTEKRFLMVLNATGNAKQNTHYLDKWSNKGWYECGVSMGSGHLTELGRQEAQKLLPWWQEEQKG